MYVEYKGGCLPIRPTDRLVDDLRIDPDDVFFDILPSVAERSGHCLDEPRDDSFEGPVETVGDLSSLLPRGHCLRHGFSR